MDFTLKKYEELLKVIIQNRIPVFTIEQWIATQPKQGIVLRHDVDRKAKNALAVAKLEHKYSIKSTFYFRITKNSFKPDIIEEIAGLGHEIGYHYEDLSLAGGDYDKAIKLFQVHLKMFEPFAKVMTIAMHGRPLSKYDNRDLWKKFDFRNFGLIGEAFLSIDYSDMYYFTDTGRNWDVSKSNLRDKVLCKVPEEIVKSTDHLIMLIINNQHQDSCIQL